MSNGRVTPHKPPVTAVNAVSPHIPRIECPVRLKGPSDPRYGSLIQDWMAYYFKTVFINVHQVALRGDRSVTAGKTAHNREEHFSVAKETQEDLPEPINALSVVVFSSEMQRRPTQSPVNRLSHSNW